ncbi:hypothetical protein [Microcoleus sp. bin38.metabat.b11b12b14.051]|uniref:hypothetical protein n=1 Tax=Microcoleus sp. bin38.metabat.b11b12b14.051 TaxID=2742709 RepID=UPI0025D1600B|nr:hypothetical protein [Microcoleus sp. bin38.metabat.b11b12b14.051]
MGLPVSYAGGQCSLYGIATVPYLKAKHLSTQGKRFNERVKTANRKLIYIGGEIRFQSEMDLEDYIDEKFDEIFPSLLKIKRQHTVQMQRCDLLCCTKSENQPVIIELKNEEDRGLVSQLTRYRKAILSNKCFDDKIDYSLPVKMIAIAPGFHKDNYTDKESSKFEDDFDFWEFAVENHNNSGRFKLLSEIHEISYPVFGLPEISPNLDRSSLPAFTCNFLGRLPRDYHTDFLKLRTLLLSQPKVKEMVSTTYRKILYATGDGVNHKKVAEITNTTNGIVLFLWLPTAVIKNIKTPVTRFGFVLKKGSNPFSESSSIEWVVCTKNTLNLNEEPQPNTYSGMTRHGMLKWCQPNMYLSQAALGYNNTFWLLINLLKGITPPLDNTTLEWWKSYAKETPTNLGWFIDLAIKTWNYRIK